MTRYDHPQIERTRELDGSRVAYEFHAGLHGTTPTAVRRAHKAWLKRRDARRIQIGEHELQRVLQEMGL
jgi:hypothetical protein